MRKTVVVLAGLASAWLVAAAADATPSNGLAHRLEALEARVNALQAENVEQQAFIQGLLEQTAAQEAEIDVLVAQNLAQQTEIDALDAIFAAHAADPSAHHPKTTSFSELSDTASDAQIPDTITVAVAQMSLNADTVDGIHGALLDQEARVADLEFLLDGFSRLDDEVYLDGMNLHLQNGAGATATANGLGNLIIGYNEPSSGGAVDRSGSHVLVVGSGHGWSSYGGIVAGLRNQIGDATDPDSGAWASITGGRDNRALGLGSAISGGERNLVTGDYSSVTAGQSNHASGFCSAVHGGDLNVASGSWSSVTAGVYNRAAGLRSSVVGGRESEAAGDSSSITGGRFNHADQQGSVVLGGERNTADGAYSAVAGGLMRHLDGAHQYP